MSMRPPVRYWIRITATGAGGSSDPTNFTLGSGDTTVPQQLSTNLNLSGILFESGANGLNFEAKPADVPNGETAANITETIAAPCFLEKVVASINGTGTTAFPFQLWYGPLGPGAR